jgi:hypothetical protein
MGVSELPPVSDRFISTEERDGDVRASSYELLEFRATEDPQFDVAIGSRARAVVALRQESHLPKALARTDGPERPAEGVDDPHAPHEFVEIGRLPERAALLALLIADPVAVAATSGVDRSQP